MANKNSQDGKTGDGFWSRLGLQVALIAILGLVSVSFITMGFIKRSKTSEEKRTEKVVTKISRAIAIPPETLEVGNLAWPTADSVSSKESGALSGSAPTTIKNPHKFKYLSANPSGSLSASAGAVQTDIQRPHKFKYLPKTTGTEVAKTTEGREPTSESSAVAAKHTDSSATEEASDHKEEPTNQSQGVSPNKTEKSVTKEHQPKEQDKPATDQKAASAQPSEKQNSEHKSTDKSASSETKSASGHDAASTDKKSEPAVKVPQPQWQSADLGWDKQASTGTWNPGGQTNPDAAWKQLNVGQAEPVGQNAAAPQDRSKQDSRPETVPKAGSATPPDSAKIGSTPVGSASAAQPLSTSTTAPKNASTSTKPASTTSTAQTAKTSTMAKAAPATTASDESLASAVNAINEFMNQPQGKSAAATPQPVKMNAAASVRPANRWRPAPAKQPNTTARLTIINESGNIGRGQVYSDVLKSMGYSINRVEDRVPQPGPTTIYYGAGSKEKAEELAKRLPGQRTVAPLPYPSKDEILVYVR
ncbi:MAG: LytR C-terminal domain-containing protein [Deltaproteobacteria bacterium]|nr:LytR C-terminal domain-containing protein [Deltaproteobacteria bacterium]